MKSELDKSHPRYRKKYTDIDETDRPGILANKICQTIFHATELVKRTKVLKKRIRMYKRRMVENILAANNCEVFAFATTILVDKNKITWMLELAERTIDFINYFKSQMNDVDDDLFDYLDNISYLIANGFLLELEKEVTNVEEYYEYLKFKEELTGVVTKYMKGTDLNVTKRAVRSYMKKIKLDPKFISKITMETSKMKSFYNLNRSRQSRSNVFRF